MLVPKFPPGFFEPFQATLLVARDAQPIEGFRLQFGRLVGNLLEAFLRPIKVLTGKSSVSQTEFQLSEEIVGREGTCLQSPQFVPLFIGYQQSRGPADPKVAGEAGSCLFRDHHFHRYKLLINELADPFVGIDSGVQPLASPSLGRGEIGEDKSRRLPCPVQSLVPIAHP